jgi:hypothetical protein
VCDFAPGAACSLVYCGFILVAGVVELCEKIKIKVYEIRANYSQHHAMCEVGEKLIQIPDGCDVERWIWRMEHDKQMTIPMILIYTGTEWNDNNEVKARWNAWKPVWLEPITHYQTQECIVPFFVKAPNIENWCAMCNVMQAQPCYQFKCAACDNEQWQKDVIEEAWYWWRKFIMH